MFEEVDDYDVQMSIKGGMIAAGISGMIPAYGDLVLVSTWGQMFKNILDDLGLDLDFNICSKLAFYAVRASIASLAVSKTLAYASGMLNPILASFAGAAVNVWYTYQIGVSFYKFASEKTNVVDEIKECYEKAILGDLISEFSDKIVRPGVKELKEMAEWFKNNK